MPEDTVTAARITQLEEHVAVLEHRIADLSGLALKTDGRVDRVVAAFDKTITNFNVVTGLLGLNRQ